MTDWMWGGGRIKNYSQDPSFCIFCQEKEQNKSNRDDEEHDEFLLDGGV